METQQSITKWAQKTFGKQDKTYRAKMVLEEAVELAVASSIDAYNIIDVVTGVLRRKQLSGFIREESADVLSCLYALAGELNFDLHKELNKKMKKNLKRPQSYYDAKQAAKKADGII